MGTYKKRKDGRYCTSLRTGKYTDDGKPIRVTLYAKTIKELEAKVAEVRYQMGKGVVLSQKDITFGRYAKMWLSVAKANRGLRTQEMYQRICEKHLNLLDEVYLKDITKSLIQEQINAKSEHPRLCEQIKLTISQILESAVDDGLILKNPCKNIELPRKKPSDKRALLPEEKAAIKSAVLLPREKAMLYILYGCGLRPAEAWALTKGDIDLEKREISVNKSITFIDNIPFVVNPKTNSGFRTVQAPRCTIEALEEYLKDLETDKLFGSDKYYNRTTYYKMFNRIKDKIGCPNISPYTLRHNYCSELYYSGVSLKEAQRLMGHSGHEMIMKVYAHLDATREDTQNKIDSIDF